MVQVYLSGPIINDAMRRDSFYKAVVETLNELSISVFAPQFLPPDVADVIYTRDVAWVNKSDVLIAEVTNPSHGVGMELMLAIERRIPILMFRYRHMGHLSKMVQGAPGKALFDYDEVSEVKHILLQSNLETIHISKCKACNAEVAKTVEDTNLCVICESQIEA